MCLTKQTKVTLNVLKTTKNNSKNVSSTYPKSLVCAVCFSKVTVIVKENRYSSNMTLKSISNMLAFAFKLSRSTNIELCFFYKIIQWTESTHKRCTLIYIQQQLRDRCVWKIRYCFQVLLILMFKIKNVSIVETWVVWSLM